LRQCRKTRSYFPQSSHTLNEKCQPQHATGEVKVHQTYLKESKGLGMVVYACNPSYMGGTGRGAQSERGSRQNHETLSKKITKAKRAGV
jgi:hypothetical protein